jgi:hypothetical protein
MTLNFTNTTQIVSFATFTVDFVYNNYSLDSSAIVDPWSIPNAWWDNMFHFELVEEQYVSFTILILCKTPVMIHAFSKKYLTFTKVNIHQS